MNYAQLFPQLFIGSHPKSTDDIERLLLKAGITAVLNLQTDEDMQSANLDWEPLEASYRSSGIELLRVPVRDFDPVDLREKLPQCVRTLDQLLATDHSVYLHCTAGARPPPPLAIAYSLSCLRRGFDLAGGFIQTRL